MAQSDVSTLQRHFANHIVELIQEVDGFEYNLKHSQLCHGTWKREFVCNLGKSGRRKTEAVRYDCGGVVRLGLVKNTGNLEVEWRHHAVHRSAEEEKREKIRKKAGAREAPTLYAVKTDTGLVEQDILDTTLFDVEEEYIAPWMEDNSVMQYEDTATTTPWAEQDHSAIQDDTEDRTMAEIYRDWQNFP
jgi:hypothetical protein